MSWRGGKRKPVLQLGNAANKLHRYGYSKEFLAKNKKGQVSSASTTLVGDYSNSDSDGNSDKEEEQEQDAGNDGEEEQEEAPEAEPDPEPATLATQPVTENSLAPAGDNMDDELKNFLSEIEAIPMPTELADTAVATPPSNDMETDKSSNDYTAINATVGTDIAEEKDTTAKTAKSSAGSRYSMFVKGEVEFAHSPTSQDTAADGEIGGGKNKKNKEEVELDIPDEPVTSWQIVQDETTQYYYYWNFQTNEVTWEIPTEYTQFLLRHKEYEEKVAKYTPEQIQAYRKYKSRKDTTAHNHSSLASYHNAGDSHKAVDEMKHNSAKDSAISSRGSSPYQELDRDSKHHKHKKDKRSHHKKKHKRKHSESSSDEESRKRSSPNMPDIGPPMKPESPKPSAAIGPKLPSIVPYYSDQDEEEEDEEEKIKKLVPNEDNESDQQMPELGPPVIPKIDPEESPAMTKSAEDLSKEEDPAMPELGPAMTGKETVSQQESSPIAPETFTEEARDATDTIMPEIDPSVLLLPPPPPPPEEENEEEDNVNKTTIDRVEVEEKEKSEEDTFEAISQVKNKDSEFHSEGETPSEDMKANSATTSEDTEMKVDEYPDVVKVSPKHLPTVGPLAETSSPNEATSVSPTPSKRPKTDDTSPLHEAKVTSPKSSKKLNSAPDEQIDMFAEDFPISKAKVKINSTGQITDSAPGSNEGVKIHVEEKLTQQVENNKSLTETPRKVDAMEEGEISDKSEKSSVAMDKTRSKSSLSSSQEKLHVRSKGSKSVTSSEKSHEASKDKSKGSKNNPKVLNIVGYGSDDEEEEDGEVKEVEDRTSSSSSSKKKKKDKRRESKKMRKEEDSKSRVPSFIDSKLDKDIISKVSQTLDQAISEIVTKTVSRVVTEGKAVSPELDKSQDALGDLDLEDIDDIDRALEVALEKKLEKKKVELAKFDGVNTAEDQVIPLVEEQPPNTTVSNIAEQPLQNIANVNGKADDTGDHKTSTNKQEDEEQLKAQVTDMADLAMSKLEFLDISTENLSRLQVLLVELQTRLTDWSAGGLSTQYLFEQLKVAEGLLEQYELSAVPEGWVCQWDRANNRYYYRSKATNRIQWEYPEVEGAGEAPAAAVQSSSKVSEDGEERRQRRHRKRDDKDSRSKHDKRSSSHRYRRKRRRRRDHSSSSNSSEESRHHHKSKKKKRHRSERSPSVEIVDSVDGDEIQIDDSPKLSRNSTPPLESSRTINIDATAGSTIPDVTAAGSALTSGIFAPPPPPPPPPPETSQQDGEAAAEIKKDEDVDGEEMADSDQQGEEKNEEEEGEEKDESGVASGAVISKPPQIVVPPQVAAAITPELYAGPELYSAPQLSAVPAQLSAGPSLSAPPTTSHIHPQTDEHSESEADKLAKKKKKKDKKALATGSSIMMKKKHMSSMVQKWQKVKKEVEKEDRAKEIRQAAIRKKIEELK